MEKEPFVVKIHDVHIEEEYVKWVNVLKTTYRKYQIRAAVFFFFFFFFFN